MRYHEVLKGKFLSRPNRFIAQVELEQGIVTVHVKNTGRCRELLIPWAEVALVPKIPGSERRTDFDLVAVKKGSRGWFNIDSQAPNKAVWEWILSGRSILGPIKSCRPEVKYNQSRLDFYVETEAGERVFLEVKGVTLEDESNGAALFPDAPTERGVRHLEELVRAKTEGFRAIAVFLVQFEGATFFAPNSASDLAFCQGLIEAVEAGVEAVAVECSVTPGEMQVNGRLIQVKLPI